MRKLRIKQIVCVILTAIMLISGMCFDLEEAHSLFSCDFTHTASQFRDMDDLLADAADPYPVYIIDKISGDISVPGDDKNRAKVWLKASHTGWLSRDLPQVFAYLCFAAVDTMLCEIHSETAMIAYIHHSDGKK